jgi:hypothetical protein
VATPTQIESITFDAQLAIDGRALSYLRGAKSIDTEGFPGETPFRFDAGPGAGNVRIVGRDWFIRASELVIDGVQIEPQRGDLIVEDCDGNERRWEVGVPMGSNDPEWRYSDTENVAMRIHAKEVMA